MKVILFINESELQVLEFAKTTTSSFIFNFAEIRDYLLKINKNTKVFIVLNLSSEDLSVDFIPKLYPWEKPAYQTRQLAKLKQEGKSLSKLVWTNTITPSIKTLGKQEVLLSYSVILNQPIQTFLEIVEEQELNLIGIYSYTNLISQVVYKPIIKNLKLSIKDPLIIWLELDEQRFIQLFLNKKFLYFSRLVNKDKLEQDLSGEVQQTKSFILQQGFLSSLDNLRFCLVNNQSSRQGSEINIDELLLADLFKSNTFINSKDLVLKALASKNYPSFYLTDYLKQQKLLEQLTIFIKLVSFVVLFYLIYLAASNYFVNQDDSSLLQEEIANLNHKKSVLLESMSGKITSDDLVVSLDIHQKLTQQNQLNDSLIFPHKQLAEVLLNYPAIQLKSLSWQREVDISQLSLQVKLSLSQAAKDSLQELNSEIVSLTKDLTDKLKAKEIKTSSESIKGFTSNNLDNNQLEIKFTLNLIEELSDAD